MFDYHLHSNVSFDSECDAQSIAKKALALGLKEICFTDHFDQNSDPEKGGYIFTPEQYLAAYKKLEVPGLIIKRGVEFGLTEWNMPDLEALQAALDFDFVIGSVHFVDGLDPYDEEYWLGRSVKESFRAYLEATYNCVRVHDGFDALGHLTYVCKSRHNPTNEPVRFKDYSDITDEIMKILISKGKGMEVNTSGIDKTGEPLPTAEHLARFAELGGEIVTIGSDSHDCERVGQYSDKMLCMLKSIFGHVCTFDKRRVIFHKL